jgi:oligopeptide/dipeptide ABC transporter ATP-binding protein
MSPVVADVTGLGMRFGALHALDRVDLRVRQGEVVGLVGESGSGKSTLGRCLLRLLRPTEGRVTIEDQDITEWPEHRLRRLRSRMTMVFQDPYSALNPRMSIRRLIEEPLLLHAGLGRAGRRQEAERLAERVHLSRAQLDRTPGELSGGQLQRVCIARAVATRPSLIVLDEPTSSLDLSVRAGILDLLAEIRGETGAAMLFITHDLSTLRAIADRVAVLYLGRVLEEGPTAQVMDSPAHPYTQALLSAHLAADPAVRTQRIVLEGEIPSPMARPPGCPFQTRCPLVEPRCRVGRPPLLTAGPGQSAACVRVVDGSNRIGA